MQQVWKDVDGVLTCDPNICPNAKPVPHLTFEEAAELAYFGAQVYSWFVCFRNFRKIRLFDGSRT